MDHELDPHTMTIEAALFGLPEETRDYLADMIVMPPGQVGRELGRATRNERINLRMLGITTVTSDQLSLTDFGHEVAFAAATTPRSK